MRGEQSHKGVDIHLREMKIHFIFILFILTCCQGKNSEFEKLKFENRI